MPAFLAPLFLVGMAAAAVPILLHLLKRRPDTTVKFAAVRLLQHAPVEQMARRRLRELLLLALRVTALVLLSLAFARPFFADGQALGGSGVTVVALDTSLSLSEPARMARAKALAREAIDAAPSSHLVSVVRFADRAEVTVAPGPDRAIARAAIDQAEAGAGSTRYDDAMQTAVGLVASEGSGEGTVVLVTDLQRVAWDQGRRVPVPDGVVLQVADVGALPPNLAVVDARALGGGRVTATVTNFSDEIREARVQALVNGAVRTEAAASIDAGQSAAVVLGGVEGDAVTLTVADPDGLQGDNVRYLVLATSAPPRVLVVTAAGDLGREAFYVQQALAAAGPGGASFTVEGVAASALASWDATRLGEVAAVVLMSTRGLDRRGRELLAAFAAEGGGILLAVGPGIDADVAPGALGIELSLAVPSATAPRDPRGDDRGLVPVDVRHPVFQALGRSSAAGAATFARVADVRGDACQPIARFTTGEPALLDCSRDRRRALVFASDLDDAWNDWPRRATFVPFLHEAVSYLAGGRSRSSGYIVGESAAADVPGLLTVPDPAQGGGSLLVAVNVDPRESSPDRLSAEDLQGALDRVAAPPPPAAREARQQEDRQHIWRYVLLAMIAMLVAESALATRTV